MFSKFKTSTVKLGGLGIIIITFCVLQYVVTRRVEKRSFECRCGMAKIGAAEEIRRKRQTVHSKLGTSRLKRDTFNQIKTFKHLTPVNSTEKVLNDKHSRIVNGYEPQRRPWITLITISRYAS